MGSSRPRNSTRAGQAPPPEPRDLHVELYDVLDHFSEALAIVQTVSNALEAAQNNSRCTGAGAEIATLRIGVAALIAVHEQFDLAIPEVDS
jgi:hypothetical protein